MAEVAIDGGRGERRWRRREVVEEERGGGGEDRQEKIGVPGWGENPLIPTRRERWLT